MSEDRGGGMWGIRPAQTSRRVESEATEHKLPVKQTITGALSLCGVVALFVAILTLIDLPAILCVALAMAAVRVLRGIEFVAWWSALVFVAVLFCAVALMTGVVSNASVGGALLRLLRTVWLPTDYSAAWLAGIDGRLVLWSRGTLVVMAVCLMFFAANLAYRMAIEVFNPNWPPTFTAALAELGPLWWTWKPKPAPTAQVTNTPIGQTITIHKNGTQPGQQVGEPSTKVEWRGLTAVQWDEITRIVRLDGAVVASHLHPLKDNKPLSRGSRKESGVIIEMGADDFRENCRQAGFIEKRGGMLTSSGREFFEGRLWEQWFP